MCPKKLQEAPECISSSTETWKVHLCAATATDQSCTRAQRYKNACLTSCIPKGGEVRVRRKGLRYPCSYFVQVHNVHDSELRTQASEGTGWKNVRKESSLITFQVCLVGVAAMGQGDPCSDHAFLVRVMTLFDEIAARSAIGFH